MTSTAVPSPWWRPWSHQAWIAMCFRIVGLGGKVSEGCNHISNQRSHAWLLLNTHCSDSKCLVQSPWWIVTL
jgi:hypothetical protein